MLLCPRRRWHLRLCWFLHNAVIELTTARSDFFFGQKASRTSYQTFHSPVAAAWPFIGVPKKGGISLPVWSTELFASAARDRITFDDNVMLLADLWLGVIGSERIVLCRCDRNPSLHWLYTMDSHIDQAGNALY